MPVLWRKCPIPPIFPMITCKDSAQESRRDSDSNALRTFATLNPDTVWPHRDISSGIYQALHQLELREKWRCGVEISELLASRVRSSYNHDGIHLNLRRVSAGIEMCWLLRRKKRSKFCMCKYLEFVRPHLAAICHVTKRMLWQLGKWRYMCLFSLWLKCKMLFFSST